jgi:DNA-binding MarR family transcriptional regulator
MIDRGLLERLDGAGRAARHRLTAEGEQARAAGAEIVDGVLADSLGHLSPRELTTLHDLLLRANGADPS